MSWKKTSQEKPRAGHVVICLFPDATKELLAFVPSSEKRHDSHWVNQHSERWEAEDPVFWHPLPGPPPIDWVPDEVFSG